MIPQFVEDVFAHIRKQSRTRTFTCTASFLEIYNEDIKDLLDPRGGEVGFGTSSSTRLGGGHRSSRRTLVIREDVHEGITVVGLKQVCWVVASRVGWAGLCLAAWLVSKGGLPTSQAGDMAARATCVTCVGCCCAWLTPATSCCLVVVQLSVDSADAVLGVLRLGAARRTTAATLMNSTSSRSHAVFTVTVESEPSEDLAAAMEADTGESSPPSPVSRRCFGEASELVRMSAPLDRTDTSLRVVCVCVCVCVLAPSWVLQKAETQRWRRRGGLCPNLPSSIWLDRSV